MDSKQIKRIIINKIKIMNKLILSAAILLASFSTFATPMNIVAPTTKSVNLADEYTEIKAEEVPAAVTESITKSYPEAAIYKAFVNEQTEYKLKVKVGEKEKTIFIDATGKWSNKD